MPVYTLSPAISGPGARPYRFVDRRYSIPESLYFRTKKELKKRQWWRFGYKVLAADLSEMSLSDFDSLALGDNVMVVDREVGLASWLVVVKIGRKIEDKGGVDIEFDTVSTKFVDYVAESAAAIGTPVPPQTLPGESAAADGDIYVADSENAGGGTWTTIEDLLGGDPADLHNHVNKPTLDVIADISGATAGWVLTRDGGGNAIWAAVSPGPSHTHPNLPTLDDIPAIAGASTGHSILKSSGAGFEYGFAHPEAWNNVTAPTKIEGSEIYPGTIQHVWLGLVTADQTAGGPQQKYQVELLSPVDKSATGVFVSNCFVVDDTQEVFEVGTKVCIARQSVADDLAGAHAFIIGVIDVAETAPPHSHTAEAFGFMVYYLG